MKIKHKLIRDGIVPKIDKGLLSNCIDEDMFKTMLELKIEEETKEFMQEINSEPADIPHAMEEAGDVLQAMVSMIAKESLDSEYDIINEVAMLCKEKLGTYGSFKSQTMINKKGLN